MNDYWCDEVGKDHHQLDWLAKGLSVCLTAWIIIIRLFIVILIARSLIYASSSR